MSGKDYLMTHEGLVVRGKRVGRTLGVPTVNIPYCLNEVTVPNGVYVADLVLLDQGNRVVNGVLNQGNHPTVPGGIPAIEIHLFDFDEELYDQRVLVRYLSFIRPELTFDSKEEMRVEMMEDIRKAKQWFRDNQQP